jgi:hypothetical protein
MANARAACHTVSMSTCGGISMCRAAEWLSKVRHQQVAHSCQEATRLNVCLNVCTGSTSCYVLSLVVAELQPKSRCETPMVTAGSSQLTAVWIHMTREAVPRGHSVPTLLPACRLACELTSSSQQAEPNHHASDTCRMLPALASSQHERCCCSSRCSQRASSSTCSSAGSAVGGRLSSTSTQSGCCPHAAASTTNSHVRACHAGDTACLHGGIRRSLSALHTIRHCRLSRHWSSHRRQEGWVYLDVVTNQAPDIAEEEPVGA